MSAVAIFQGINLALEGASAALLIATRLSEFQAKRAAEGREVTDADVTTLMNQGDVKAAQERLQLAAAKLAQEQS